MLKIYKSLESGPLQELSLKTLERGAWINIIDPTPYELKVVGNLTEVEPDFLRSALDDEERSHTDVEDDSVMVLTNVPIMREIILLLFACRIIRLFPSSMKRLQKPSVPLRKPVFCFRYCINQQPTT